MTKNMNISIIIPNYNGEKILPKNLPHILVAVKEYKKGKVEIIIPNDPSTDKSKEVIASFIRSLQGTGIVGKTIDNSKKDESGFSKNVNRGVALATGDILVLLNSDVRPHKIFLSRFFHIFLIRKCLLLDVWMKVLKKGRQFSGVVVLGTGIVDFFFIKQEILMNQIHFG